MAKNSIIHSLTADEREALAFCGITQDVQLARTGPRALQKDLEAAADHFPESLDVQFDFSRLEYICQQAAASVKLSDDDVDQLWNGTAGRPVHGGSRSEEPQKRRYSAATGRMLVDDQHEVRKATLLDERRRKEDPRDFSHAICCARPVATYLGAWATVFLVAAVIVLMLGVAGLLIGIEYTGPAIPTVAVLVGVVLFYAIMLNSATCSTCRISIFSFRRYPRHRKAHYIPLLGNTLATALYTIFMFRYRCPSCGTPQKLFGKRHRSRKR